MKHEAEIIRYDLNINDILSSCSTEKFKVKKINQSVPKINAEINPDKVLLGDTELNNLGPPKIFPKIYAAISLIKMSSAHSYGQCV